MARCSAPPVEQQEPQHHSLWATIRPQLALAAGFALLVGVGSLAVKLISAPASNEVATSSYINTHDVEAYEERQQRFAAEGSDDEAIVEYLLMAGNVRFL